MMTQSLIPLVLLSIMSFLPQLPVIEQHRMYLPIFSYLLLFLIPSVMWFPCGLSIERKVMIVVVLLAMFNVNIDLIVLINRLLFFPKSHLETRQIACSHLQAHFTFPNNFYNLPNHNTILVTNYVRDRFENIFCLLIPRDITIIATNKFLSVTHIDQVIDTLPTFESNSFELLEVQVVEAIKQRNKNVFCYIEKPVFLDDTNLGEIRTGIFHIARRNNITVTPIYFDPIQHSSGMITPQTLHIIVGSTFVPQDVESSVIHVRNFFTSCKNR